MSERAQFIRSCQRADGERDDRDRHRHRGSPVFGIEPTEGDQIFEGGSDNLEFHQHTGALAALAMTTHAGGASCRRGGRAFSLAAGVSRA